ncbi:MAG: hypothetical protein J3R72DRAFT_497492 [Linnemannia gamsii]|nr:MAG: hypothetical protein J3R72DRAFT_497492 [Linnemannia gamsii]
MHLASDAEGPRTPGLVCIHWRAVERGEIADSAVGHDLSHDSRALPNQLIGSNQDPFNIVAFLAQVVQEREHVDELRSVRFQLVAKAVSNMGEHSADLQPLLDRSYCRLHSAIQEMRSRYHGYLLALCNSLETDYKRLQIDYPEDLIIHTEFLCDFSPMSSRFAIGLCETIGMDMYTVHMFMKDSVRKITYSAPEK